MDSQDQSVEKRKVTFRRNPTLSFIHVDGMVAHGWDESCYLYFFQYDPPPPNRNSTGPPTDLIAQENVKLVIPADSVKSLAIHFALTFLDVKDLKELVAHKEDLGQTNPAVAQADD